MDERKRIDLEQGWNFMQKGIAKLKNILEGLPEPQFGSEDYVMLYTTIYNTCTQKPPHGYSQQLYEKCCPLKSTSNQRCCLSQRKAQ